LFWSQIAITVLGAWLCYEFYRIRLAVEKIAGISYSKGFPFYIVVIGLALAFIIGYSLKMEENNQEKDERP
jgi:hypothetical protein